MDARTGRPVLTVIAVILVLFLLAGLATLFLIQPGG